jgi:hypothetical protein
MERPQTWKAGVRYALLPLDLKSQICDSKIRTSQGIG